MEAKRHNILIRLLVPIAKISIRLGVPLQEIYEAMKVALVDEAAKSLENNGEKATLSRISIMTGIHRPDVRRILKEGDIAVPEIPIISKIIGQWQHDDKFKSDRKLPKPLSYGSDSSEFSELVKATTKNYSPGTLLQELLQQGMVTLKGDKIYLESEFVDYRSDENKLLNLYVRNAESLSKVFEINLSASEEERNINLRTEYDNIFLSDLPKIRNWLLEETAKFHKKIRSHLVKFDADLSPNRKGESGGRVVLGSFGLTEASD